MINRLFFTDARKVLRLAVPIIGTSMISVVSGFVGMIMVARLGHQELAAAALATSTFLTLFVLWATVLYAVGILVSHECGKEQPEQAGMIVRQGVLLAFFIAIPVSVLLWFGPDVLIFFRQKPALVAITVGYFHFAAFVVLPALCGFALQQFFIGISKPKVNLRITYVTTPLTIALCYLFVFGKFGFPALGLSGVALAMVITMWAQFIFLILFIKLNPRYQKYNIFTRHMRVRLPVLKQVMNIGTPIGIQYGGELAAFAVTTYFMGWISSSALAAQQIVMQCAVLVVMISLGFSQALSVLVSEGLGKNDLSSAKRFTYVATLLGVIFMLLAMILYIGFPDLLIGLFLNVHAPENVGVVKVAVILFFVGGFTQLFDSTRNIIAGGLRGFHDSKTPMWASIISLWGISIPASYLFAFTFHGGPLGLRIGFMLGIVVCAIWLLIRFQQRCVRI